MVLIFASADCDMLEREGCAGLSAVDDIGRREALQLGVAQVEAQRSQTGSADVTGLWSVIGARTRLCAPRSQNRTFHHRPSDRAETPATPV